MIARASVRLWITRESNSGPLATSEPTREEILDDRAFRKLGEPAAAVHALLRRDDTLVNFAGAPIMVRESFKPPRPVAG
jgi:hypothetical protein